MYEAVHRKNFQREINVADLQEFIEQNGLDPERTKILGYDYMGSPESYIGFELGNDGNIYLVG